MKLLYTTSIDVPSTRANRVQVTSMAHAFSQALKNNFLLGLRAKAAGYSMDIPYVEIKAGRSYFLAWKYLRLAKDQFTHVYCREEKLLFFLILYNQLFFRLPLIFCYEVHHLVYTTVWWHRYILRHTAYVISITRSMKEALVSSGYSEEKILVAPDAVDIGLFDITTKKDDARRALGFPLDKHLIVYAGRIDEPWKGSEVLYEAMTQLDENYLGVIVGGKPHYVEYFNALHPPIENLILCGHQLHDEIPLYLKAADVLVLPNSAKAEISRISTSPMKLFEYMAADRPIVASDLPSLREILNEKNALFVEPDSGTALAQGIRTIIQNPEQGRMLAAQARKDVSTHTWENRAAAIVSHIAYA